MLKNLIFLVSFLITSLAFGIGRESSNMPSTFFKVSTPNTHLVEGDPEKHFTLLRGATPRDFKDLQSLKNYGIKNILIFKNQTKNEVDEEISELKRLGYKNQNITYIPFLWGYFDSFKNQCQRTLLALQVLQNAKNNSESTYYHCTAGEDRTGYLTALWKFWQGYNSNPYDLMKNEMCPHGYADKNPKKPAKIAAEISASMTPLYFKMYSLLSDARDKDLQLDEVICPDIEFEPNYNLPPAMKCQ